MVEVDATTPLIGPDGAVALLEAFEGRRQLIAYYWTTLRGVEQQSLHVALFRGTGPG